MSRRSKPSLKFLIALALWLGAIAGAYAQEPPEIAMLRAPRPFIETYDCYCRLTDSVSATYASEGGGA
jgi:hypothetical protein